MNYYNNLCGKFLVSDVTQGADIVEVEFVPLVELRNESYQKMF